MQQKLSHVYGTKVDRKSGSECTINVSNYDLTYSHPIVQIRTLLFAKNGQKASLKGQLLNIKTLIYNSLTSLAQ